MNCPTRSIDIGVKLVFCCTNGSYMNLFVSLIVKQIEGLHFQEVRELKFKSRKDWWLAIIIWGAMLFTLGSGAYALSDEPANLLEYVIIISLAIALPIFILWLWFTTFYRIDTDNLIIRFGPFRKIIPLDAITSVKKSTNPLSSPAWSLKRLEIRYGKYQSIFISPVNREEFVNILSKHCPHVKIEI